jgi:phosphatidylserine/phosphatidylglycerophosphate/cardiolipin synthase-like enzyme
MTNMDALSFGRLEEGSIVADAPPLAAHLERALRGDFARSEEITREEWAKRDPVTDVVREAASFFSEWM